MCENQPLCNDWRHEYTIVQPVNPHLLCKCLTVKGLTDFFANLYVSYKLYDMKHLYRNKLLFDNVSDRILIGVAITG